METTISYAVPANALRVFRGFQNQTLTPDQYRATLGQTFMPGTPYMLAPLGLAAYLPGVIVGVPDPNVPNEFAIIAYPSQDVWQHIMNGTLRGRVYNATHGGVYDPNRSGASFPVALQHLPALATDAYYLFDGSTDWQTGVTQVFVGAPADSTVAAADFRQVIRTAMEAAGPQLKSMGADQCVVMPGDSYVVIWTHFTAPIATGLLDWKSLGPKVRAIANMEAQRVICHGEPPTVALTQSSALNFIFLRAPEMFLF